MRVALSIKYGQGDLVLVEGLEGIPPKTKAFKEAVDRLGLSNALIVTAHDVSKDLELASRNVADIEVIPHTGAHILLAPFPCLSIG